MALEQQSSCIPLDLPAGPEPVDRAPTATPPADRHTMRAGARLAAAAAQWASSEPARSRRKPTQTRLITEHSAM